MRVLDLVLAIVLLWAIVAIAQREFPGYDHRVIVQRAIMPPPAKAVRAAPPTQ